MYKIGYFSTSQLVTFRNNNNKVIYKINLFNDYKNYLVSYNGSLKGKIIIKIKPIDDKHANIIDVIGLINDDSNNYNIMILTLQYIYNISYKSIYTKELKINLYENSINRIIINKFIFSIDPESCNDIDDALSFEETDTHYIISVYIAQPITYLTLDIIREHSKKAFSTLYNEPYINNKNLWNDSVTLESSLHVNKLRNVYAIVFHIDKTNNKYDNVEHFPAKIINKLKTNYEECLKYDVINKLYNITSQIDNINDTHELVSYWMVQTNNYIGNQFNVPYRVMKKCLNNLDFNNLDDDINKVFINKLSDNAYYSLTDDYHSILNKTKYTHMTSPIRRIIDTIVHWCITYNVEFKDLNINLEDINILDKFTKKYHNKIKLLNHINNLEYDIDYFYDGWIFKNNWEECLEKKNCIKITVYFKELGFQRVELLNKKFNYLLDDSMENEFNNIKVCQKYKFLIQKKIGFLPDEKIFIKLLN